jgi:uncharacterized protein
MALWDKLSTRGSVEDRRSYGPGIIGGGLGVTVIVIYLLVNFLGGGSIGDAVDQLQNIELQPTTYDTQDFEGADTYEVFASTVLGSTNEMWSRIFSQNNLNYYAPKLVLFRNVTASECGGADSRTGPHYCPLDQTIYLDETFFDDLKMRVGVDIGDVAQAYVIAHEVGHNVQYELNGLNENISNSESIKIELQADCYAGLWAYSIKDLGVFEPGEIKEALDAASAVGDDRIQTTTMGRINPETWTHGSSAERVAAFNRGYNTGNVETCSL